MDSIGIENLTGKLTFPELLVKQVAEQIINEQIISNGKIYSILIALLILTSASSSFLTSYFRKRGENFATKTDFQHLLNQMEVQTKITEEVKTVINHKDWATKEWKTLKRIKLEELMSSLYDIHSWHQKTMTDRFYLGEKNSTENPLYKSRMIVILYFPELSAEFDLYSKAVGDFDVWSAEIHVNIVEAKNDPESDPEKVMIAYQLIKDNTAKFLSAIIQSRNTIESKSYEIMANLISIESHQN